MNLNNEQLAVLESCYRKRLIEHIKKEAAAAPQATAPFIFTTSNKIEKCPKLLKGMRLPIKKYKVYRLCNTCGIKRWKAVFEINEKETCPTCTEKHVKREGTSGLTIMQPMGGLSIKAADN